MCVLERRETSQAGLAVVWCRNARGTTCHSCFVLPPFSRGLDGFPLFPSKATAILLRPADGVPSPRLNSGAGRARRGRGRGLACELIP